MDARATWTIVGIVGSCRELTSDKNKAWRGYVVSIMTMGATLEVSTVEGVFKRVGEGQAVTARGRFEQRDHSIKLIAEEIVAVKP